MKGKVLNVAVSFILLITLLSGCTSTDGLRLSNAMAKQFDYTSMQGNSKLTLHIDADEFDLSDQDKKVVDLINGTSIILDSSSEIQEQRVQSNYEITTKGISFKGDFYSDGQKLLLKIPTEDKYLEFNQASLMTSEEEIEAYNKSVQLVKDIRPLAIKFVKDYLKEYKYTFDNLTNKGKVSISTPTGMKKATHFQISLTEDELVNIIKYTAKNLVSSKPLKEYLMSAIGLAANIDPTLSDGTSKEEILKEFESQYTMMQVMAEGYLNENEQTIDLVKEFFDVGPKGIVFNYYIDSNGNIAKTESVLDLVLIIDGKKLGITLESEGTIDNINKAKVNIPSLTQDQVMPMDEYFENNETLKGIFGKISLSPGSKMENVYGPGPKTVTMQIGESVAYVNDDVIELDAAPFIQDGSAMVPLKFIGDVLNAGYMWNDEDKSIIYYDGQNSISMEIGSKTAMVNGEEKELPVAPIIVNGRTMIPLRFVSEEFGASVEWIPELKIIVIEKN